VITGCEEKVVIPLIKFVEPPVPKLIEPLVKLVPILMTDVTDNPLIVFIDIVDAFRTETLVGPRVIEPLVKLVPIFISKVGELVCMESMMEEIAFNLLIVAVDTFKSEVFAFLTKRSLIVEVETLIEVDCKLRMNAVELFKTDTLVGAIVIDPPDKLDPIVIMDDSFGPMIFNTLILDVLKLE
jgi:hypothetical protein